MAPGYCFFFYLLLPTLIVQCDITVSRLNINTTQLNIFYILYSGEKKYAYDPFFLGQLINVLIAVITKRENPIKNI